MLCRQAPAAEQRGGTRLVLEDETLGVFAGLNVLEALAHRVFGRSGDDLRTGDVFAVFGVIGYRIVHVGDAAFIDHVDYQLELVQAFKIRHFRRVAGFHQRLKARLDQFHRAATKNCLFAEQIGLCLFAEVGFNNAGLTAAVGHRIAKRQVAGPARFVLGNRDQVRDTASLGVGVAHRVAGRLGRDHPYIEIGAGRHQPVMHIETVRENQRCAGLDVGFDVVGVNGAYLLVGQQDHHHVGGLDRFSDFGHLQPRLLDLGP